LLPLQDQVQLSIEFTISSLGVHFSHKLEVGADTIASAQPPFPHTQFIISKLQSGFISQSLVVGVLGSVDGVCISSFMI
jgi:hypothetical protein